MKNLILFISFLLLALPVQVHTDVLVYGNILENHKEENTHHEQHKNDSDKDKDLEHHHHCSISVFQNVFIPSENNFNIQFYPLFNKPIIFYIKPNYSSYIAKVFQPPQTF